ncbi:MAG: mechanosensitive ion channel [Deltaproteobacteria bacterium]
MRLRPILVAVCVASPGAAFAQFPLPQLGNGDAPEVRIATDDPLTDEIDRFLERVQARHEERKKVLETYAARLERAKSEEEVFGADRLARAMDRERELMLETVDLAQDARRSAQVTVTEPDGTIPLTDLVEQELIVKRLADEVATEQAVLDRLDTLVSTPPKVDTAAGVDAFADAAEVHLQRTEAEYARARLFERTARHRLAVRRATLWREHVGASNDAVEAAKNALRDAETTRAKREQELTRERKKLREAGLQVRLTRLDAKTAEAVRNAARALVRAKIDHLVREEEKLSDEVQRAQAILFATQAVNTSQPIQLPPDLLGRVSARIAKVDQDRSSVEVQISSLRDALAKAESDRLIDVLRQRREVYENDLALLLEIRQTLRVVQTLDQIAREREVKIQQTRAPLVGLALTLFVIGAVFLLLTLGTRALRKLFGEGGLGRILAKTGWPTSRAEAVAVTLWPIGVFVGAAALLVWPIWRLDLTVLEALQVLERPLFYVEDTGVSLLSVIELVAAVWVALVISRFTRTFLQSRVYGSLAWDIGLSNAINTFVHYGVMMVGVIIGLRFVGIGASSFALVAGVLGIGIGFGLRNVTENFISGLIILAERPIKLGDYIDVEGQVQGRVQQIRARSTTVVTRDNISVIIPNSEFVGGRVTNWSHGEAKVRISVAVGVAYGSDTDLVRKLLLEVAQRHGQVLKKPAPEVQFRSFGESSLDFELLVWIEEQQHRFRIASDLHFAVDKSFRKMGVEIAFPQLDLHLKSVAPGVQTLLAGPLPIPEAESNVTVELPVPRSRRPRSGGGGESKGPDR